MLIFITLIYYAVCVYASFYFTMNYGQKLEDSSELDKDYICLHGPHIYGLYTYAVIACNLIKNLYFSYFIPV